MRKYITIRETVTNTKLAGITCDWCGKCYENDSDFNNEKIYETNKFKLNWDVGVNYPECSSGTSTFLELCHKCRGKFFEELKKLGIEYQKRNYDF